MKKLALKNIPFMAKLVAAPLFAALSMAFLGWTMRANSTDQVERMDGVVNGELAAVVHLSTGAALLHEANGMLYYMMTNVAAGLESIDVEAKTEEVLSTVDSVVAGLARYRESLADSVEFGRLEDAAEQLQTYREAVEFVGSMLQLDFNSAVAFVEPFQANYHDLYQLINGIVAENVARSQDKAVLTRVESASAVRNMLVMVTASILLVVLFSYGLARALVRSIRNIAEATLSLAEGNLDIEVEGLLREDELGDISRSLITFKVSAHENARLQRERIQAEEQRLERERRAERREAELEEEARQKRRIEMLSLSEELERSVLNVADAVMTAADEMEKHARVMNTEAEGVKTKSEEATSISQRSLDDTQTVAGTTEELSSSVKEITSQASRSTALTRSAVEEATAVDRRVRRLAEAAANVSGIVDVIGTISRRTRLLALNATIEAGSAGEAGKGFSVIASEVRMLADQTAEATEEIAEQIESMQDASSSAQEAIAQIVEAIQTIDESVTAIACSVGEQDSATEGIARTVHALSGQAVDVTDAIASIRQSMGTTRTVAMRVLEAAQQLSGQATTLKEQTNRVLSNMRAVDQTRPDEAGEGSENGAERPLVGTPAVPVAS